MRYDAFTAGVELGGLRTTNDIKILICYMIYSVKVPLTKSQIIEVLIEKSLANYFEVTDALENLLKDKHIINDENGLSITESGEIIATRLDVDLPYTVRTTAVETALSMLNKIKIINENPVEIAKTDLGYNVTCHISGGEFEMLNFTLYVPEYEQAKLVKKNFQNDPSKFYNTVLQSLIQNR